MDRIHQASPFVGNGSVVDLFGQTVSDTLDVDLTPAHLLIVQNTGSSELFIGGSAVTSSTGQKLAAGASTRFELQSRVRLWATFGVGSTGTVRILIILK